MRPSPRYRITSANRSKGKTSGKKSAARFNMAFSDIGSIRRDVMMGVTTGFAYTPFVGSNSRRTRQGFSNYPEPGEKERKPGQGLFLLRQGT
jgi:hypothetical protein